MADPGYHLKTGGLRPWKGGCTFTLRASGCSVPTAQRVWEDSVDRRGGTMSRANMASKSEFELLFAQEQEQQQEQQQEEKPKQQVEENYVAEGESHGTLKVQGLTRTGCCPIFAGTGEISDASISSELQSHGTKGPRSHELWMLSFFTRRRSDC